MKVYLKALGCRLNEAELEQWSQTFQSCGFSITQQERHADLIVLNTCAVTHEASRKSRYLIKRLHRENPLAKLVVTGCHASLEADKVADAMGVDLVVTNAHKARLPKIAQETLALPTMPLSATDPEAIALYSRGRHRAFIKIQDGCRYRCTYCIVTRARGEEVSRPMADIITEVNRFHAAGIQEIVLTGVHVGGYGSDIETNLYDLVRTLLRDTDIPRIRYASVEPWDLPDYFFDLFENSRIMPHMHLPLQSGSDVILRKMSRRCKTQDYARLVDTARRQIPGFNVTSDIIVGFPGETDALWQASLQFIQEMAFGDIHIFPYSPRAGTKAASLPNQLPKSVKQARVGELAALASTLRHNHLSKQLNTRQAVLWEKPQSTEHPHIRKFTGYTPNFTRVEINATEALEYQVTDVNIHAIHPNGQILIAEPL